MESKSKNGKGNREQRSDQMELLPFHGCVNLCPPHQAEHYFGLSTLEASCLLRLVWVLWGRGEGNTVINLCIPTAALRMNPGVL